MPVRAVLASSSTERRVLLAELIADFEVVVPRVVEKEICGEPPEGMVLRLAREKAVEVAGRVGCALSWPRIR